MFVMYITTPLCRLSKEFGSKAKVHNRKVKEDSNPKIVYRLEGKCLVHVHTQKNP